MAADRRLLLVHAHPDDETIATGGTMARYAATGAHVALVTCTRGEQGEIVPPELRGLGTGSALAEVRVAELAAALRELGVSDHRWLGDYEDSGMSGTPANGNPRAFRNADPHRAVGELVGIVRELRPQAVVTYDERGGYGHPDHVQAHRFTMRACDAAGDAACYPERGAPWRPAKVYHVAWGPPGRVAREIADYVAAGRPGGFALPEPTDPQAPEQPAVTTAIDVSAYVDRKLAALAAHRTQLTVAGRFFALSNGIAHEVFDAEWYVLARGAVGPRDPVTGLEDDLFGGVESA